MADRLHIVRDHHIPMGGLLPRDFDVTVTTRGYVNDTRLWSDRGQICGVWGGMTRRVGSLTCEESSVRANLMEFVFAGLYSFPMTFGMTYGIKQASNLPTNNSITQAARF